MSSLLFDSISRIARHEVGARAVAAVGVVKDVHPGSGAPPDHAVTVELRDSGLALPRVPVAVGALGVHALPASGDLVTVLFLEGDYNAPVIVGSLYHSDLEPPPLGADRLGLYLPPGDTNPKLKLEVDGATPSIKLEIPQDVTIEVLDGKVEVKVGEIKLTLTSAGGGRAELLAGGSKLVLKQDGDVTLSSAAGLKLEGAKIEIASQGPLKLTGATVEIN